MQTLNYGLSAGISQQLLKPKTGVVKDCGTDYQVSTAAGTDEKIDSS